MNKNTVIEFCKDHKRELIIGGILVGTFALGYMTKGKFVKMANAKKVLLDVTGKSSITWDPKLGSPMNLDRIKSILDANANNSAPFAIFREGLNPNEYACIVFDDSVIIPAVATAAKV